MEDVLGADLQACAPLSGALLRKCDLFPSLRRLTSYSFPILMGTEEFLQIPAGYLHDDIIERWLEE